MGIDVDTFLAEIALRLRRRSDELATRMLARTREEIPTVWAHEDLANLAAQSFQQHVDTVLSFIEHRLDTSGVQAPPSAVGFATRLAERGVPISELLRTYRLGHATVLDLLREEASRLTTDPKVRDALAEVLIKGTFDYVDRTSEQAVTAYQRARDSRLQRRLIVVNEASRRIGTSLDIARTAQELAELGTDHLADFVTVDLLDAVLREEGPAPAQDVMVLRRIAQHSVLAGCPESVVPTGHTHSFPRGSGPDRALATGHPLRYRIRSTDLPAWVAESDARRRAVSVFGMRAMLLIPLWARGSPLGVAQFFRHRDATPFDDDDLLLAQEITSRAAVYIDNARRYTHERATALALQRSLLPNRVPRHGAVETASRYLPSGARAGVGGDWYDVIPLSGARVALVIGDVVGRGLYASATMGRLRTAVRTLADIDLMPDELLTHLDDVVIRMQHEEGHDPDEISATCLYAVYDPVSRICSLASAGHVLPAVALPAADGDPAGRPRVHFADAPIGPPLGLGGLPFETAQFELPEGSLLALFTDGLVAGPGPGRDPGGGLARLCDVLARSGTSLEDTCDRLLENLLPSRPTDDVALLLTRTHTLDADHVSTLELPSDPTVVSRARAHAMGRLAAWNLDDLAFSTELMVSELVTNAIRYGREPISLRMILQSTLTCEVADAAGTAPHLRRARTFDEGGRGLFLVAQLAENWGTRYTREGKVIWAEQPLPGSS
ncbi:SpoIIE family protein phosphatase [Streptomyces sp. Ag109_G2-15]|uniref:ATP-binding SpoIIE family protein phosphatase n=1 Tax=Streptomyces sp. Ag109_G2-15 TaxID=1938850 RepID=UPI000BDB5CC3|nr:SpoIIE family protein phosphatase [Streptomyces sp. Ag109_G2-15]SOE07366.1 Serine phosphatase RsbU, regulator of sigma subunit [Streptomyces sp. Ag109_G2-15]